MARLLVRSITHPPRSGAVRGAGPPPETNKTNLQSRALRPGPAAPLRRPPNPPQDPTRRPRRAQTSAPQKPRPPPRALNGIVIALYLGLRRAASEAGGPGPRPSRAKRARRPRRRRRTCARRVSGAGSGLAGGRPYTGAAGPALRAKKSGKSIRIRTSNSKVLGRDAARRQSGPAWVSGCAPRIKTRGIRSPDLSKVGDVLKHQPIESAPPSTTRIPPGRRNTQTLAHIRRHPTDPQPANGSSLIQDSARPVLRDEETRIRSFSLRKEKEPKRNDYCPLHF